MEIRWILQWDLAFATGWPSKLGKTVKSSTGLFTLVYPDIRAD